MFSSLLAASLCARAVARQWGGRATAGARSSAHQIEYDDTTVGVVIIGAGAVGAARAALDRKLKAGACVVSTDAILLLALPNLFDDERG